MKVFREDLLCSAKGSNHSGIVNTMKETKKISSKILKLSEKLKTANLERNIVASLKITNEINELVRQREMIKKYFKKINLHFQK